MTVTNSARPRHALPAPALLDDIELESQVKNNYVDCHHLGERSARRPLPSPAQR
jgi:hypothetical protein